jgi:hypothetical protein
MKLFDPTHERDILDGHVGYKWVLGRPFASSTETSVLASKSNADLDRAVQCLLVGYDEPAYALLKRVHDVLGARIREKENAGDGGREPSDHNIHFNFALCTWLLHGEHDQKNYTAYVKKSEQFLDGSKELRRHKPEIGLALPEYVDARAYQEALALFHNAGMKPPASLARIRSEAQMSYVLCRYQLGEAYEQPEIETTIKRFLKHNVNTWLLDGQYTRAAEWMKIAHWSGEASAASAREAVLHCYDYLAASPPMHEAYPPRRRLAAAAGRCACRARA